ncbi:MAG TPA: matrixin family metalloprotease [Candidatus Thermoplasmatota archaeon]|nr:matrixin family metalloprotease [Candidatus Thermoplasmatota archaeon]
MPSTTWSSRLAWTGPVVGAIGALYLLAILWAAANDAHLTPEDAPVDGVSFGWGAFSDGPLHASTPSPPAGDCSGAWNPWKLWPGFLYNETILRAEPLDLRVSIEGNASTLDWSLVNQRVIDLLGVRLVRAEPAEDVLPIRFLDPVMTDNDVVQYGLLNTDQFFLVDTAGNVIRWHTTYEIRVYHWEGADEERVVIHELGHALGLVHVLDEPNLMHTTYEATAWTLHECSRWLLLHVFPVGDGVMWGLH